MAPGGPGTWVYREVRIPWQPGVSGGTKVWMPALPPSQTFSLTPGLCCGMYDPGRVGPNRPAQRVPVSGEGPGAGSGDPRNTAPKIQPLLLHLTRSTMCSWRSTDCRSSRCNLCRRLDGARIPWLSCRRRGRLSGESPGGLPVAAGGDVGLLSEGRVAQARDPQPDLRRDDALDAHCRPVPRVHVHLARYDALAAGVPVWQLSGRTTATPSPRDGPVQSPLPLGLGRRSPDP